jgi:hypothetical protein
LRPSPSSFWFRRWLSSPPPSEARRRRGTQRRCSRRTASAEQSAAPFVEGEGRAPRPGPLRTFRPRSHPANGDFFFWNEQPDARPRPAQALVCTGALVARREGGAALQEQPRRRLVSEEHRAKGL